MKKNAKTKQYGVYDCCGKGSDPTFSSIEELVDHFKKEHPYDWYSVWDAVGKTWDDNLNDVIQKWKTAEKDKEDALKSFAESQEELKKITQQFNILVQKWNAILVIIRY